MCKVIAVNVKMSPINTYYRRKTCSVCLNTHIHVYVMDRANTTVGYKRRHANNPTGLRPVIDLISYVGTSTSELTETSFSRLHALHATRLGSLQSVFMNVQPPHFTLSVLKLLFFFCYLPHSSRSGKSHMTRDHSTSPGSLTFHTPCFCYSTHAQPMPFTFTLLAHAKCRAVLETHCSCSEVSPYDKLFKDHLF